MSDYERLLAYAKSKGMDTEALARDFEQVAAQSGVSLELLAYSFRHVIEWDQEEGSIVEPITDEGRLLK